MAKFNPRLLLPVMAIGLFAGASFYVNGQRARQRSVLSGYFESQPAQLAARVQGRVARLPVQEGQAVRAGESLVELDAAPAQEDAAAKQATAEQAHQQQREAENGPRPEEIKRQAGAVAEAQANLTRLRNGPLPEEIAQSRARLRQAEAAYRKARAGARPQEIAQARAAERSAYARLAQSERGLTAEEKAQAKARLDAAVVQETLTQQTARRYLALFREGAISALQRDQVETERRAAEARRRELEEAYRRALAGTPPEELEQARQNWQQAKAALDLVLAGTRREDIEAASAERTQAQQALQLIQRGTRQEDIQAGAARLVQAQAVLSQLQAGNRKEQIAQAQAAARAAEAAAKSVRASLSDRTVRAPQEAVVERVLVAVGDLITPGTPVVRIADPKDIWLRIYVPESHLAGVQVGSPAELRVDGVSGPVMAEVESIGTRGEFTPANLQTPDERGKQVFSVRLRLQKPDGRIKAGMAATVVRIGDWKP